MKIKLNPELIAKVMIALRQEGEDPNDYFEMEVDTGTTLVEGQTRLTEFIQPDETPVEQTVPGVIRAYVSTDGKTVYKINGLPGFESDDLHEAITEAKRQKEGQTGHLWWRHSKARAKHGSGRGRTGPRLLPAREHVWCLLEEQQQQS